VGVDLAQVAALVLGSLPALQDSDLAPVDQDEAGDVEGIAVGVL
jgi:hypothetical protein